MKINKSIKIWTIAFLSVDLLFWLYLGFSCTADQISCAEMIMLGSYFYYLPFTLLPLALPPLVWEIVHIAFGVLIGWLLRHHPVRWWLASIISFVVLVGVSYGFGYWQMQQELERETTTQLWLVDQVSATEIQFRTAQHLADGTLNVDDGSSSIYLAAFDTSDTKVDIGTAVLSYSDFLAAKVACHQDKTSCVYPVLKKWPILFEVTSNPQEIIEMKQLDNS